MEIQQILHIAFSYLPFTVCLFWFICFTVNYRKHDASKHFFMLYIGTCVVLYFCHALFFTRGISHELECLWTLCSLSVYPLFYGYLCRLTESDYHLRQLLPWLLPGIAVATAKYLFPEIAFDKVRLALFTIQIVIVCYYGISKLKDFDHKLNAVYVDTEGRDTTAVHNLLIAIIVVSMLSGVANSIGKQFFGESLWLLIPISTAFTIMQFLLSHISFYRNFTIDQLNIDGGDSTPAEISSVNEDTTLIGRKIEELMSQKYFLKKDLKISDLVTEVGSNRTYVSNYINRTYHCSFSYYMNQLRIEYAKQLILSADKETKQATIAEKAGFASEQSFYRNFKKFTGQTPASWLASQKIGGRTRQNV